METNSIIHIHFSHFSSPSHSPNMTCRNGHETFLLWAQGNQHNRYFKYLVVPVLLDLYTSPSRQKCWLIISRPSVVTPVGALVIFSLPSTTLWLSLRMMNLLLCFPGRVRVSRSNGTAPLMSWYILRIMVRVIDLNWFLVIGVTWLLSSIRVKTQINCSTNMVLSLTPSPRKMLEFKIVQIIIKCQLECGHNCQYLYEIFWGYLYRS